MRLLVCLIIVLFGTTPALLAERAPVTVFAAASLRGALDEIAMHHGDTVTLSYGGSGTMARQIAAGAPADLVVLASTQWMDWLENSGSIIASSRIDIIANQLVLIGPVGQIAPDDPLDVMSQLGALGRLAMGQRDAVPAGSYAREWLQNTQQWDALAGRLAETDNVRAALALVARGQAPVGVVYATDALSEPAVHILAYIPDESYSPIVYPAAALTGAGQAFLEMLTSSAAQSIFVDHGFESVRE